MPRTDVSFRSGGDDLAAWLYEPDGGSGPHPCVVLAHGFGATRAARLGAYAERFAAAGYAALVFDYRHFGASGGEPRQLLDVGRQHEDWRAAIAYARSLDQVDADRVALWGSSFSGGHVAVMAADDSRVAAVISQAPFMDGLATLRALGVASTARLTYAGLRDEWARLRNRPPAMMPIVGPPGTTGAMTTPDALPGYSSMFEPGEEWRNEVAGRIALRVAWYRPGRRAAQIACPWLVQVCEDDAITPVGAAAAAAARAQRSQLLRYPGGHFDIYTGELFERVVTDQISFLDRVLRPAAVPPAAS